MIKKFKCTVTRVDEYEIEFDTEKYTEKKMEEFRESFYNFDSYEEHAEHLAQIQARFSGDNFDPFIEGYGNVKRNFYAGEVCPKDKEFVEGITIVVDSEDKECEVEVEEIKE